MTPFHTQPFPSLTTENAGMEAGTSPPRFAGLTFSDPMSAEWHPHYGALLAGFPRSIVAGFHADYSCAYALNFWPDLATLVTDGQSCHLLYHCREEGRYSICAEVRGCELRVWLFEGVHLIRSESRTTALPARA